MYWTYAGRLLSICKEVPMAGAPLTECNPTMALTGQTLTESKESDRLLDHVCLFCVNTGCAYATTAKWACLLYLRQ